MEAIVHYGFLFPEVFGGARKDLTAFPVNYPTSCYPQAWAAGATILFLRTLLGVNPSRANRTLELNPIIGPGYEEIVLEGVEAFGQRFRIEVKDGSKFVETIDPLTQSIL